MAVKEKKKKPQVEYEKQPESPTKKFDVDRILRFLDIGQALFTFSFGKHNYSVPSSDIVFFEKDKRSVFIYTKTGTYKSLLKTKEILEKLPNYFIQIHASYILNPKYIYHAAILWHTCPCL